MGQHEFFDLWRYKWRRRFYKPFDRLVHRGHYFVYRYFAAVFLVNSENVGGLEISTHIGEHRELENFIRVCSAIRLDATRWCTRFRRTSCFKKPNGIADQF